MRCSVPSYSSSSSPWPRHKHSFSSSSLRSLKLLIVPATLLVRAVPSKIAFLPIWHHCRDCKRGTLSLVQYNKKPCCVRSGCLVRRGAHVWIEEAEDGFVDEDENLMMGEKCLFAIKAFAGTSRRKKMKEEGDDSVVEGESAHDQDKRLLCAGALVQRPPCPFPPPLLPMDDCDRNSDTIIDNHWDQDGTHGDGTCRITLPVCDVWMADGFMDETNLQYQGGLLILDELFYHHLNNIWRGSINLNIDATTITCAGSANDNTIERKVNLEEVLSTFVVQCGGIESECHFASHRAVKARGFKQLKELPYFQEEDAPASVQTSPLPSTTSLSSTTASLSPYCWKYLTREEEDLDAFILDINDLDKYMKDPSSPRKVVDLLQKIKILEKVAHISVFQ